MLLLFYKNIIDPELTPKYLFHIIAGNEALSSSIRHSCYKDKSAELLHKSIAYFHKHNRLVEQLTEFLNVINCPNDIDWSQKEIAMYGLFEIARKYGSMLDDAAKATAVERLENALCQFCVNEYAICQLIGAGGRSVHLIKVLGMFLEVAALTEINKTKIFKNIILSSKNEQFIQTILSSTELRSDLANDDGLKQYCSELYKHPLTLNETRETIANYYDFSISDVVIGSESDFHLDAFEELEASNVERNLIRLITLSDLSEAVFRQCAFHIAWRNVLRNICQNSTIYLSHSDFVKYLTEIRITEFNFEIPVKLIRFIAASATCLTDEVQLKNLACLVLSMTIRLPNVYLQHDTFKYIVKINKRFSLVHESVVENFYSRLQPVPDLIRLEVNSETKSGDMMMLGLLAEERNDFELALKYYHKAEDLDYNYHFHATVARALVYLRKAMPYAALELLLGLEREDDKVFDFALKELIYRLSAQLGLTDDAIYTFEQINKVLPFYRKNILSYQSEIQVTRNHPLSENFGVLRRKVEETFKHKVTSNEAKELYSVIQNDLTQLSIPQDVLVYCSKIFLPLESIQSSEYPNEWKRILLNYVDFVFREVASIDYHWKTAVSVHSAQTEDVLEQHIEASELHEVYSRVFREDCTAEKVSDFLTNANVKVLTITEFVRRYGGDFHLRGGYALGYSEDIAQTYDIYCFLFGLIRWETAYYQHNISYVNDTHTPDFLDTISRTGKPIVFFLPTGLSSSNSNDKYLGVTYRECQWILENIRKGNKNIENVILILDAYNYLPYHLLTEIRYFYNHGLTLQFAKVSNREFDKTVDIAIAAAQHFLTYVVDADKIELTRQTFIDNIQKYLSINIESVYSWIENTVKFQNSIAKNLKVELIKLFNQILSEFFKNQNWEEFYQHLKQVVCDYQRNHSAIKCLAIGFCEILKDVDFIQYFLVMLPSDEIRQKYYQHYLRALNFVSPLVRLYEFTEHLERNVEIDEDESKLFTKLLDLFQSCFLKHQLGEKIEIKKLFEELANENVSLIQNIFTKLAQEIKSNELFKILSESYDLILDLWQAFESSYKKFQVVMESDYAGEPLEPGIHDFLATTKGDNHKSANDLRLQNLNNKDDSDELLSIPKFATQTAAVEKVASNYIKSDDYRKLSYAIQEGWDKKDMEKAIEASLQENEKLQELKAVLRSQAKIFGFAVKEMERDGNCFFHGALDQLQEMGYPNSNDFTAEYLRQCVTQHLIDYSHLYKDSVDDDMNEFIAKMSQPGEWPDNIVIQALSRVLNVTIVLVRSDAQNPTIFRRASSLGMLYLGYEVGLHFQSLVIDKAINPEKNIKDFIEQAEIVDFNEPVKLPANLSLQSRPLNDRVKTSSLAKGLAERGMFSSFSSSVRSEDEDGDRFFSGSSTFELRKSTENSFLEAQSRNFLDSEINASANTPKNSAARKFMGTSDNKNELNFEQWLSRDSVAILLPLLVQRGNASLMAFCALDGGIGIAAYSSQMRKTVQEARKLGKSLFVISKEPVNFPSQHYVLTIFHKERIYFIDPTGQVRNDFCHEFIALTGFYDMKNMPLLASRSKLQNDPDGLVSCDVICLALCEFFSEESNLKKLEEIEDKLETKKSLSENNAHFLYNEFELSKILPSLVSPETKNYRGSITAYRAKFYTLLNELDETQIEKLHDTDRGLLEVIQLQLADMSKAEASKQLGY